MKTLFKLLIVLAIISGCVRPSGESLPILGERSLDTQTGEITYYQAPQFAFTNQSNKTITSENFNGKIYVVDFFFSSCPTICPVMTNNLTLVQERFRENERVGIISYSIDPTYDTPERLAAYADLYQVDASKWSLLTGDKSEIFEIAKDYKVRAFDDTFAGESNLIHDGTFVLIDDKRRIRGYYDGLSEGDVQRLIEDIDVLLKTM
jgi:protein SCO1/2